MTVIDELLVGLGFEYDPKQMDKFKKDLDSTARLIGNLSKVAVSGAAAIFGFTAATTAASDEQGKLADETGVTVESIDALQFALKRSGGSSEGMASSLRNLAVRAGEATRGVGAGVEAFGLLGISVTDTNGALKTTDQLMLEVSQQMQGLTEVEQIELADKLGLRESLRLLQQGPSAIKALTDEAKVLGVTTAEDATLSAEFQDSLTDIWQVIKSLSRTLTREFAPVLTNIANSITDWWKANRDIIQQNLPAFIDKAVFVLKLLSLAAGAFVAVKLATTLFSLIKLFKGLQLSALLANAAIIALPVLIGAAIAAIALLAEDAKVFFEGGESFIGDMIEKFPEWSSQIETVAAVFATLADLTTMVFDGWAAIFDLFSSDTSLEEHAENLKNIASDLVGSGVDSVTGAVSGIASDVSSFFGFGGDDQTSNTTLPSSGITNSSATSIDKIEIRVDGSSTPEATAEAVMRQFQQASQDVNSAVHQ